MVNMHDRRNEAVRASKQASLGVVSCLLACLYINRSEIGNPVLDYFRSQSASNTHGDYYCRLNG